MPEQFELPVGFEVQDFTINRRGSDPETVKIPQATSFAALVGYVEDLEDVSSSEDYLLALWNTQNVAVAKTDSNPHEYLIGQPRRPRQNTKGAARNMGLAIAEAVAEKGGQLSKDEIDSIMAEFITI